MTGFHVDLSGRGDLATRIYQQILAAIRDGTLRGGDRMPPTRELAERLSVSRNTVAAAYDRLTSEGYLTGRVGSGTFVGTFKKARPRQAPAGSIQPRALWGSIAAGVSSTETPDYDFRVGVPDPAYFPVQTWRRLIGQSLSTELYRAPTGSPALRAAIARYIGQSRSVRAAPDDVIVTQGAQQALDLVGRVLIDPGTVVAVEEPGYPPARALFASLGARVVSVPVDAEGLAVQAIPRGTRLVYTTPSHQFPLGMPMSLERRIALLDWVSRHDAAIIEDDYDSEYRFADRPLAPLQSLDHDGRVIYVGSFSKTLLPALRLGFLVAPESLQPALRTAKQLTDWHGDLTTQATLARFIEDGYLARHVRKTMRGYDRRRTMILDILRRDFADVLDVVPSVAGLHVTAHLHPHATLTPDPPVAVRPLARFCADRPLPGLVIGYGAIRDDRIADGLRLLRASIHTRQ
ncbi:PLP-dependent aminotransferase family protein [Allorhizocola rhizosphaerae]|uniref:MocR-like pyridoxine biosynthesis transcription factor PdxR n=1 Tax=Allorhizocola rhizosphaerae TaxID=1872709 RepID=UPI001FE955E1|nr:PLP-dependent aminotransferase family protein [Allorhizocola rhizosphaerae]